MIYCPTNTLKYIKILTVKNSIKLIKYIFAQRTINTHSRLEYAAVTLTTFATTRTVEQDL